MYDLPPIPHSLPQAIARQEGWYLPEQDNPRCHRNHNPGNIRMGNFARSFGAVNKDNLGFAIFPDDRSGWMCLHGLLLEPEYYPLSLHDAIFRYAPPVENASNTYLENVCSWTRSKETDLVSEVFARVPFTLQ